MDVEVEHRPAEHRYVATADGEEAGEIVYRLRGDVVAMTHTEVDPRLRGRGVGSALVAAALADVRARGRRVEPLCPFVAAYVRRHGEDG